MNNVYEKVMDFKNKYSKTVAFRLKKHSEVIKMHLNPGEEVTFAFCAQRNVSSFIIINSCVVALTNKRIMIGQKRFFGRYDFTTITPDMYNDLKVIKNFIWSDIEIDTIKENLYLSNIDPKGAIEIETNITEFMMLEKQKYEK